MITVGSGASAGSTAGPIGTIVGTLIGLLPYLGLGGGKFGEGATAGASAGIGDLVWIPTDRGMKLGTPEQYQQYLAQKGGESESGDTTADLPGFDWYGMLLRLGVPAATAAAVAASMGGKTDQKATTESASTAGSGQGKDAVSGSSQWLKYLAALGIPASTIAASLISGGSGDAINPTAATPIYPELNKSFGDWLQSYFKDGKLQGATPYSGQLSPDISQTLLPGVWNQYSQGNPAQNYLQAILGNIGSSIGSNSPLTQQMMQWGGTGGPGNYGMSNLMQFGVASEGSGRPLANLAYGVPSGAANFLLPFLNQTAPAYRAPTITRSAR